MREILFRGKCRYNGEWVEGHYVKALDMYGREKHVIFESTATFYSDGETSGFILVNPETICQYTGLTDKNGKKIWENDILSGYLDDDFPEAETRVLVLWQENGWCAKQLECNGYEKLDVWYSEYFEVIGNVVDNPKLLEV